MSDTATIETNPVNTQAQSQEQVATADISLGLANSLWGNLSNSVPDPLPEATASPAAILPDVLAAPVAPAPGDGDQSMDLDEYFIKEFGVNAAAAKTEWESLRKLKETGPAQAELQFANDESKNFFNLFAEGKRDELRAFLNQQDQIERLEKLGIENTIEAAEILRATLQFKNKNLSKDDIEFMVEENYMKPNKPVQALEEGDDDFTLRLNNWEDQVKRIDRKMIIDAKLAQNEIPAHKSQIVLPEIPKVAEVQQPNQKELDEATRKAIENYHKSVQDNYHNFKGFTTTAKDGEVQLPINYGISPEELIASKAEMESFDINVYFEQRWLDENRNPKILQIQEDLYLMKNRDKIFQSIATEAASQRYLHHLKSQNNINLSGVNPHLAPPAQSQQKTESQTLAEQMWKI